MIAEVYWHPTAEDIEPFKVPQEHWDSILDSFKNLHIDQHPMPERMEIGSIRIQTKNLKGIRICWYTRTPGEELHLSINGFSFIAKESNRDKTDPAFVLDEKIRVLRGI
jgi:phage/plasmid primase-like uncharacterized protein